jgi:hypothetical protein
MPSVARKSLELSLTILIVILCLPAGCVLPARLIFLIAGLAGARATPSTPLGDAVGAGMVLFAFVGVLGLVMFVTALALSIVLFLVGESPAKKLFALIAVVAAAIGILIVWWSWPDLS